MTGTQRESEAKPRSALREELWLFLEVLGLSAFAIAQPVLDVFGQSPETFVFRGAGPLELVLFALIVAVVPAVVLWALALPSRAIGSAVRLWTHTATLLGLFTLLALQVGKRTTPLLGVRLALPALVLGLIVTWLVVRLPVLRSWLRFASLATAAFVVIFLVVSPAGKLIRQPDIAQAGAPRVGVDTPVVMLLFDELPLLTLLNQDGKIDARMFPNFAELARTSTWYRDYTVNDPATNFSIPTILSGKLALDRAKDPLAVDYPNNLFTLLRETHRLEVFEFATELCPRDLCAPRAGRAGEERVGLAEEPEAPEEPGGLAALLTDAVGIWSDVSLPWEITRDVMGQFESPDQDLEGGERPGRKLRALGPFLRSLDAEEEKPGMHFLHVMLPHTPWRYFPSGVTYRKLEGNDDRPTVSGGGAPTRWVEGRWPAMFARQRHILQARFVDRILGTVTERLKESGMFDEALLVVTSDHGIGLQPGGNLRTFDRSNLHEVLWVPLLVKDPGQSVGEIDETNLMAVDLLPTVADRLGVRVPFEVDGIAASDPKADRRAVKTVSGFHLFGPGEPGKVRQIRHDIPKELLDDARARLRRAAFRPAVDSEDVEMWPYLVGEHAGLLGMALTNLDVGPRWPSKAEVVLPEVERLRDVDVVSGPLPALVWGTVEGATRGSHPSVVAALNGRVAGVSETFSYDGIDGRFAMLMPDSFFREGANRFELFVLSGSVLRPVRIEQIDA